MRVEQCRAGGGAITPILDLGLQPLGNGFLAPGDSVIDEYRFPLQVGFNETSGLVQLIEQPSPHLMFHAEYAFMSSTSQVMQTHFSQLAAEFRRDYLHASGSPLVVELGCNDGVLLRNFVNSHIRPLGIEPASAVAAVATSVGVPVLPSFFSMALARQVRDDYGTADIITAANVMCHIPDILDTAEGIAHLLAPHGVLVFEDPYLGDVLRLTSYDQFYDEHVFMFSATSVDRLFRQVGMELFDIKPLASHGGSLRYYLCHAGRRKPSRDLVDLLHQERQAGVADIRALLAFSERVASSAQQLRSLLSDLRAEGARIAAYGATSKSTTIYNYAGLDAGLIEYIVDNTPAKIGRVSPGVHIPIYPEFHFAESPPSHAFLGAWNHATEIRAKNGGFERGGGRWITHVPTVQILP